ncbi:MAG TPA: hypothetical protein VGQ17_01015 [Gemmatimonadales bacterium]|jgi:hypothetical protein|nr:hypothetical protein [Gemmatimonadales bacterium]
MSGCLTLPFRLAALLLLVLLGFAAWSYRREIRRQIHAWTAEPAPTPSSGRAEPARAVAALRRLDSLARAGRDSVVLTAGEVASLVALLTSRGPAGAVDSVEAVLGRDDLELRARVDTRKVPVSLGPAAGLVRDHEYVEAGGPMIFRRNGLAEWRVQRVRVRGLPLPQDLVDALFRRLPGGAGAAGGVVAVKLPRAVNGLRVTPGGVTLYGPPAPGAER